MVIPNGEPTIYNNKKYHNIYRNILILITDGYIEAGLYDCPINSCRYLSQKRIDQFRSAFINSGQTDVKSFIKRNDFGITPSNNPHLENLELLVLELYDRSLTKGGNATVHPTDSEIIKTFWSDWLEKSKVKRFELVNMASSKNEMEKIILDFIGVI